jgi:hypothetical protein
MGWVTNAYKILVEKPERKEEFENPGGREVCSITADLKATGWMCVCVDWIHLVEDWVQCRALVKT